MKQQQARHFHIQGDNQHTALDLLHQHSGLSKQALKEAAIKGAVWVGQSNDTDFRKAKHKPERVRRLKKILTQSQALDLYYNPDILHAEVPAAQLVADHHDYSVWIKPRGMLSQGSKWADYSALYRWVELYFQEHGKARKSWIVHRLDRATKGLMLLAHSKKMAQTLTHAFAENQVHKTYRAVVWGTFSKQKITSSLPIDDKHATSHISLVKLYEQLPMSLLEITIETGRKHQIRKHLQALGYPIVGDRLYGDTLSDEKFAAEFGYQPDLQLTAFRLEFICPFAKTTQCYQLPPSELDLLQDSTRQNFGTQADATID